MVGPCNGFFRQWYYDAGSDDCHAFDYGGCQGNPNRFNNAQECQQRCQRLPRISTTEAPAISADLDLYTTPSLPQVAGTTLPYNCYST